MRPTLTRRLLRSLYGGMVASDRLRTRRTPGTRKAPLPAAGRLADPARAHREHAR
ncbi:hypothetical protein OG730_42795 (plasmid) [Streptomyces sp. NBC_01298]|uniref:hypothetical protein n=1 Tax=Streptomyces sp. NBC_01298 TaxID=2903817 RepID=UPI002E15EC58|nr:hypothetical protein OG730_42795 [Streptomyces sp. NBC_01298]